MVGRIFSTSDKEVNVRRMLEIQPAEQATARSPGWSEAKSGVSGRRSLKPSKRATEVQKPGKPASAARFAGSIYWPTFPGFRSATPGAKCLRPLRGLNLWIAYWN